ncbi:hypothetical protein LTR17_016315 [Elasticomyces elasticus]|nr:hypothetical protein LTR17_016315 [Elasticomyces elasticus]
MPITVTQQLLAAATLGSSQIAVVGLAVLSGLVCNAFAVDQSSKRMLHSWRDPSGWSQGWESIGTQTFSRPFAADDWSSNRLDVFGVGVADNGMYHQSWDGQQWQSDWEYHGGVFTSGLAVTSWSSGRLDVFGLGTDSAMYHLAYNGSTFGWQQQWDSLGGTFTSAPAVASWSADRLDVFGNGSDYAMY